MTHRAGDSQRCPQLLKGVTVVLTPSVTVMQQRTADWSSLFDRLLHGCIPFGLVPLLTAADKDST
jgi:hypothetical protein